MARNQTEQVLLRLTPEELEGIDRVRGGSKRSTWIRDLCMAGVRARDAFGGACGLRVRGEPAEAVEAASVHPLHVPGETTTPADIAAATEVRVEGGSALSTREQWLRASNAQAARGRKSK